MPSRQTSTHTLTIRPSVRPYTHTHAGVRDVHGFSQYHNPKPQVAHCLAQQGKIKEFPTGRLGAHGNISRFQVCAGAIPCCVMRPCPAHGMDLFSHRKTTDIHTLNTMTTCLQPMAVPQQLRPDVLHAPSSHGCACHHSSNPTTYASKVLAAPGLAAAPPTRWGGYQTTSISLSPRHHTTHVLEKMWGWGVRGDEGEGEESGAHNENRQDGRGKERRAWAHVLQGQTRPVW